MPDISIPVSYTHLDVYKRQVYDHCAKAMEKGAQAYEKWVSMMEAYKAQYPDCYKAYQEAFAKGMPAGVDIEKLMQVDDKPIASRAASGNVLNQLKDMEMCIRDRNGRGTAGKGHPGIPPQIHLYHPYLPEPNRR